ncbi:MAG: hypothetical protein L7S40_00450 [Rhodobacteraceae bacterium]|nr:hypothetical protein [Paracoccaceae bacterium]
MKDSKFEQWATRMYMRNCEERILHKEAPYTDRGAYIEKNLDYLKEQFLKSQTKRAKVSIKNER